MSSELNSTSFVYASDFEWEASGDGVRRKVLGYFPSTMTVRVEFKRGAVGYIRTHPHRQITDIESGRFGVEIWGRKEELSAGDCFIVEPDVAHGVEALEDGNLIDVFSPAREDFPGGRE